MKKILITRKLIKSSEEYASKIFVSKLNKEDKEYFYQSIESYLFDLVELKVRKDNK